ncbi:hypothetical protein J6590_093329, partial [Homalodisca vitripennis]
LAISPHGSQQVIYSQYPSENTTTPEASVKVLIEQSATRRFLSFFPEDRINVMMLLPVVLMRYTPRES